MSLTRIINLYLYFIRWIKLMYNKFNFFSSFTFLKNLYSLPFNFLHYPFCLIRTYMQNLGDMTKIWWYDKNLGGKIREESKAWSCRSIERNCSFYEQKKGSFHFCAFLKKNCSFYEQKRRSFHFCSFLKKKMYEIGLNEEREYFLTFFPLTLNCCNDHFNFIFFPSLF